MAGAPPPCNPVATPPAGAASVCITWFAHWPILFTDCPPISAYESTLLVIHNNGGAIYSIEFKDASGAVIPGDWCSGAPPGVVNPPPPPPPPPAPPPPEPTDDELTINFNILFSYLLQLINLIKALTTQPAPPPGQADTCCRSIVTALHNLTLVVAKIEATLSAGSQVAPPFIDLTAVVTELECVCARLTAISTSSATVANDLAPGLKSIADAITNVPKQDLSELIKAILHSGEDVQVPKYLAQLAVQLGLITPEDAQVAGDPAHVIIKSASDLRALAKIFGSSDELETWLKTHVGTFLDNWLPAFLDYFASNAARDLQVAHDRGIVANPAWKRLGNDITTIFRTVFKDFGEFAIGSLSQGITSPGDVHSSDAIGNVAALLANSAALASGAYAMTSVGGIVLGSHSAHLNQLAELFALAKYWEIVVDGFAEAMTRPIFGNAMEQHWNKLYRSEIPSDNAAASMFARGLLDTGLFQEAVAASGLRSDFEDAHTKAAYSGLNARMLLRIAGTGLFSDADIADELTFGGMRPSSQHRLISAAAFLGTEPERHKLLAALERVYAAGLISDNNFIAALDSAAHNTDSRDLSLRTVQLEKQIALAKEYEAAYSREFLAGLLDAPGYQSALEALGMQPPDVAARMFRDETHLNVTSSIQAARQARAQQRAEAAAERKTAIEGYRTGNLNEAALAAALLATGLSPTQVAATTSYQVLQSAGVLRWIFGLKLPPAQATLLREQVADLTRQREIEMLTDAQYVSQLQALSIPPRYIQALRAGANAHISPKTAAILTPPVVA